VRRSVLHLALLGVLAGAAGPARPQTSEGSPEFDPLNHAYSVYLGSGYYVSEGRSLFVLRAAPKVRIRSEEEHPFGIRLRFNTTLGFFDFAPEDLADLEFPERIGTFAFVPGVEFPVKVYPSWTLMPFLDLGVATDTEFHDTSYVLGIGARSRAEWRDSRHVYALWNELVLARHTTTSIRDGEDYTVFRTDFEMRGLVDFTLARRPFDLGVVAGADIFFNAVVIDQLFDEPKTVNRRYELGLTVGPTEKWQMLKKIVTAPRLGISYRFGEGASSIRFIIRTRY
jgi:hypothetical protein